MTWGELDLEQKLWVIPEDRMKGGVQHRVPLTDGMLRILESQKAMASIYVFEG